MWLCWSLPERRLRPLAQVRGSCPCRVRRLCELECPCRRWCHWSRQFLLCISDCRFSSEKNCAEFSLFSTLEQLFKDGGCSSPSCTHSSSIVLCFLRSLTDAPLSLPSLFDCRPLMLPVAAMSRVWLRLLPPFRFFLTSLCPLSFLSPSLFDCRPYVAPACFDCRPCRDVALWPCRYLWVKHKNNKNSPSVAAFPFVFSSLAVLCFVVYPWRCCDAVASPSDSCRTNLSKNENCAEFSLFSKLEQLFKMEAALPILSLYV